MRNRRQMHGGFPVNMFLSPLSTIGHDFSTLSSGAFKRFTQRIRLFRPFILETVLWDVYSTGTYNLEYVDSIVAAPTVLRTLVSGQAVTGGSEITFSFPHILLMPGTHYISLYNGTSVNQRRNATNIVDFGIFVFDQVGYDGGSPTVGSTPIKLVGCYYDHSTPYY